MGLSEWPEKILQDSRKHDSSKDIVKVIFETDQVYVIHDTDKAIALSDDDGDDAEIFAWIPKSQIDGSIPERDEWIETIRIPKWLAEDKGLDFEWLG